jgi:hypothetical protein
MSGAESGDSCFDHVCRYVQVRLGRGSYFSTNHANAAGSCASSHPVDISSAAEGIVVICSIT